MESWHQLYTCIGTCGVKGESAVCCEDFCVVCVSGFALVAAHPCYKSPSDDFAVLYGVI